MDQNKQWIAVFTAGLMALALMTISTAAKAASAQPETSPAIQANQPAAQNPAEVMEKCFGIVKVGQNDCDTNDNNCAPTLIDAAPTDWIYLPKSLCDKLVGAATFPGAETVTPPGSKVVPVKKTGSSKTSNDY